MIIPEKLSTEEKILLAAEQVFLRSGYDGSRMQEIADLAGINKAMLHYYFRSKDVLFEKIFEKKFVYFLPKVKELVKMDIPFVEKVCKYAEMHIHLLSEHPYLPLFIINTVHKDKNFVEKLPSLLGAEFIQAYYDELMKGKVKEVQPAQFLMSVVSMCVFPFLSKPILCHIIGISDEDFKELMKMRIDEVKTYINYILKP